MGCLAAAGGVRGSKSGGILGHFTAIIMTNLLTFQDALATQASSTRHLLLGNGFSRACRNDLFAYDALFTRARQQFSPTVMSAFEALNTTDFEEVMRALKLTEVLVKTYAPGDNDLARRLKSDADSLREILANVIASNHPERSNEISDDQFKSCRAFLNNFKTTYTLNYDLLLYWTSMKDDVDGQNLKFDDGFRQPDDGPRDYVVWGFSDSGQQNVFYMHGALHIFDAGAEVQKYTWSNTGIALIDQILEALEAGRYPIYVSEGTSQSKLDRVMHSSYLIRGYRSLSQITGSLFIFGHSLQQSDEHVLKCIEDSNVQNVYVSIFGDPDSPDNQRIINRAQTLSSGRMNSRRRTSRNLEVMFYDAASASVWG